MMSLLCDWEKRVFSRARAVLPQRGKEGREGLERQEHDPGPKILAQAVTDNMVTINFIPYFP
jgi:hypothetical protein